LPAYCGEKKSQILAGELLNLALLKTIFGVKEKKGLQAKFILNGCCYFFVLEVCLAC